MFPTLLACSLGAFVGLRHALEPDHVAAVSTLLAGNAGPRVGAAVGAWWGVGHAAGIMMLGGALVVGEVQLSPALASGLELLVAVMLMVLGVRSILLARETAPGGPPQAHGHLTRTHAHPTMGPHVHVGAARFSLRPLLVGCMHGLAGSGALVAMLVASQPTQAVRLMCMLSFCVGSVASMALLTGALAVPLRAWSQSPAALKRVTALSGALSCAVGAALGVETALHVMGS